MLQQTINTVGIVRMWMQILSIETGTMGDFKVGVNTGV
jgi:hypothetical protein